MFLTFLFFGATFLLFLWKYKKASQIIIKKQKMRRVLRLLCFDQGGCYEAEYNKWPKDSRIWFRPLKMPHLFTGTIVNTQGNFVTCALDDSKNMHYLSMAYAGSIMEGSRVRVHKREVYDILSAPHFHYGLLGHRENFVLPSYPHYRGKVYNECIES